MGSPVAILVLLLEHNTTTLNWETGANAHYVGSRFNISINIIATSSYFKMSSPCLISARVGLYNSNTQLTQMHYCATSPLLYQIPSNNTITNSYIVARLIVVTMLTSIRTESSSSTIDLSTF